MFGNEQVSPSHIPEGLAPSSGGWWSVSTLPRKAHMVISSSKVQNCVFIRSWWFDSAGNKEPHGCNAFKIPYTYWEAPVLVAGCRIVALTVTLRSSLLTVHSYRERAHSVPIPLKKCAAIMPRQYLKSSWSVAESRHQLSARPLKVKRFTVKLWNIHLCSRP